MILAILAALIGVGGGILAISSLFVGKTPGAAESMQKTACTRMVGFHLVDGAGHWVHADKPEEFVEAVKEFING